MRFYIGVPSPAARRAYLKTKEPSLTDDELRDCALCRQTDGFSVAHLRKAGDPGEMLRPTAEGRDQAPGRQCASGRNPTTIQPGRSSASGLRNRE